jgi:uncharacterized protein (UPF0262 family)
VSDDRLVSVEIDESGLPAPTPDAEQERRVALFDLIEANRFRPLGGEGPPQQGPYRLTLGLHNRALTLALATEGGADAGGFRLSLAPFEPVVRDYYAICASYVDAVRRLPPAQIEAIDAGRRAIHDVGASLTRERLGAWAEIDEATARRLFTLICVLGFPR